MQRKTTYQTDMPTLIGFQVPETTRTYKAISHKQLIETTLETIDKAGFNVDKQWYTMAKDGKQATGRYTVSNMYDNDMQLQVGWQNSYDKSISLKFALGANIMICSNGCVHGDMGQFKKKHKGDVQEFTPKTIIESLESAGETFKRLQDDRDKMKQIEITKRATAELLGRMFFEEEIITSTQLNIIKKELEDPSYDYKAPGSLWEVYNFATMAMKESHPQLYFKEHIDLHAFVQKEFNLAQENPIMYALS